MDGLAYVNFGRVIVDCPAETCANAYLVNPGDTARSCDAKIDGCGASFQVLLPDDLSDIVRELDRRPDPRNRNWFPSGHPRAERMGYPTNQSVADLASEFARERGE